MITGISGHKFCDSTIVDCKSISLRIHRMKYSYLRDDMYNFKNIGNSVIANLYIMSLSLKYASSL